MSKFPEKPERIRELVNKERKPLKVAYLGPAWDIASCLLHTAGTEYVFIDELDPTYGKYAYFGGKDNNPVLTIGLVKKQLMQLGYKRMVTSEQWKHKDDTYLLYSVQYTKRAQKLTLWYYFYVDYTNCNLLRSLSHLKNIDVWYSRGAYLPIGNHDHSIELDQQHVWITTLLGLSNKSPKLLFFYNDFEESDDEDSIDNYDIPYEILNEYAIHCYPETEMWEIEPDSGVFDQLRVDIYQM